MNNTDVPIWEKYTLTIEEASKYFRIGSRLIPVWKGALHHVKKKTR